MNKPRKYNGVYKLPIKKHAKINLQFAIMDLKALQYEQDQEANEMGREYLKEMFGNDPIEDLDKLTIRGDK